MRQIIKNGTIVTGSGSFPADILIDGEKIAATGTAEEIKNWHSREIRRSMYLDA